MRDALVADWMEIRKPRNHVLGVMANHPSQEMFALAIERGLLTQSESWYQLHSSVGVMPGEELPCSTSTHRSMPQRAKLPMLSPHEVRDLAKATALKDIVRKERETKLRETQRLAMESATAAKDKLEAENKALKSKHRAAATALDQAQAALTKATTDRTTALKDQADHQKAVSTKATKLAQDALAQAETDRTTALKDTAGYTAAVSLTEGTWLQATGDWDIARGKATVIQPATKIAQEKLKLQRNQADKDIAAAAKANASAIAALQAEDIALDPAEEARLLADTTPLIHPDSELRIDSPIEPATPDYTAMDVDLEVPSSELFNLTNLRAAGLDLKSVSFIMDALRSIPSNLHPDFLQSTKLPSMFQRELERVTAIVVDDNSDNEDPVGTSQTSPLHTGTKRGRDSVHNTPSKKRANIVSSPSHSTPHESQTPGSPIPPLTPSRSPSQSPSQSPSRALSLPSITIIIPKRSARSKDATGGGLSRALGQAFKENHKGKGKDRSIDGNESEVGSLDSGGEEE